MSKVLPNEGSKLYVEIATVMTEIPRVISMTPPSPTVASIPTTALTSSEHEKRPSRLADPGQLSFTIEYDPNDTVHKALFEQFDAKAILNWKFEMVDDMDTPAREEFTAFITGIEGESVEIETNHERTFNLELTDEIERTAGANTP